MEEGFLGVGELKIHRPRARKAWANREAIRPGLGRLGPIGSWRSNAQRVEPRATRCDFELREFMSTVITAIADERSFFETR